MALETPLADSGDLRSPAGENAASAAPNSKSAERCWNARCLWNSKRFGGSGFDLLHFLAGCTFVAPWFPLKRLALQKLLQCESNCC